MKVVAFLVLVLTACVCRAALRAPPLTPDYYDPSSPDHTLTDEYVVEFHEEHMHTVDVHALGAKHGMRWVEKVANLDQFHAFVHENKSEHLPLISTAREVKWVERQVLRKRYKRTTDPLWQSSWYMHDHRSEDLNVEAAWAMGFDGTGVTVASVDDGVYHRHDEFLGKFVHAASHDFNFNDDDVDPYHWDVHGTAAAGVATAAGDNNKCSVGVAPGASIAGIRILARDASDSIEAKGVTYKPQLIDIYSNSWGPNDNGQTLEGPGRLLSAALESSIASGRDSKGSIFVWACGNGREVGDTCNYDGYANSRYTIAIGSYEWNGKQAYYSESCAALVAVTPSSDRSGHQLLSASVDNQCYTHFGGTSASSPAAAGIVALMLQARPALTWRDVQGVIIESALPVDAQDDEWTTNGAGFAISYKYGFGRMDAQAQVSKALSWDLLPAYEHVAVSGGGGSIPDHGATEAFTTTVTVEGLEDFVVEHVEVEMTLRHRHRGELGIMLTAPTGTNSVLAVPHNDPSANYFWTFMSLRHWGERPNGEWVLQIADAVNNNSGSLNSWKLHLYGHRV